MRIRISFSWWDIEEQLSKGQANVQNLCGTF
jgi:hypothetical protein